MHRTRAHTLAALAPLLFVGAAHAATLTFYASPVEFDGATSGPIVEDWESTPNGSSYDDAYINSVYGETRYEVTYPAGWPHQVWQGDYNARNSSFRLQFDDTSITSGGGIYAVSLLYANYDTVWVVFVRFADSTTDEFALPPGQLDNQTYLAFSADVPIASIHLCKTGDVAGISNGTIWLETLTIAAAPPPACAGDVDADNDTDVFDFAAFAGSFGTTVTPFTGADLDGDGIVTVLDFATLAADFGCTPE